MANVKMGFEGLVYRGTAGSTATTLLENIKDVSYNLDIEKGNTTVRGDSTTIPIETEDVSVRKVSIEFNMINDTTDTDLETIRAAAFAGTIIALRLKDHSSGKGFDGDVTLSVGNSLPLAGEQDISFTATPSRSSGRSPSLYV